jgi:hypothetical protein
MVHVTRSRVRDAVKSLNVIHLPNPSGRTMSWDFAQPLTEMTTRERNRNNYREV